jgi:flagellin
MAFLNGSTVNDDGTVGKFEFQVGANNGQIITHTIADMGFRPDPGLISFETTVENVVEDADATPPIDAVAQVSKLTLSGVFFVDDEIEFIVDGVTVNYTVVEEDLVGADNDAILANIAAKLEDAFDPDDLDDSSVSRSGNVFTFTAGTAGTEFDGEGAIVLANDDGALTNLRPLSISNNTNANISLVELDVAINRVNTERAGLGAVMNRLNYAVDNLANVSMNTSESRSRIMDADYAKSSSELARTQIISQAATAMLAQANQQPQTVLQLLQG